ncbi:hypothetical protein WA026_022955 [Henosepilachna vigintioctopunctata]|uniref:Uncharacterized protein n=1 Tax=Henosepilachna vigintioctopunctata TaxID=420089 RepID=A0AAW1TZK3_9CUCU
MRGIVERAILILLPITSSLPLSAESPVDPNQPQAGCLYNKAKRCQDNSGHVALIVRACNEIIHVTGKREEEYLCSFLSNCNSHPKEWQCSVPNKEIDCHNCIVRSLLDESILLSMNKQRSIVVPQSRGMQWKIAPNRVDEIMLLATSSIGVLSSLVLKNERHCRKSNIDTFANNIFTALSAESPVDPNQPQAGCLYNKAKRCQDNSGHVALIVRACNEIIHVTGKREEEYLCSFLSNCNSHPKEWQCSVLNKEIDCHNCIVRSLLDESILLSMNKQRSIVVPQSRGMQWKIAPNRVDEIMLLATSSIGVLSSLVLYRFYSSKKIN